MGKASILKSLKKMKVAPEKLSSGPTAMMLKNEKGELASATVSLDKNGNVVVQFGKLWFGRLWFSKKYVYSPKELK